MNIPMKGENSMEQLHAHKKKNIAHQTESFPINSTVTPVISNSLLLVMQNNQSGNRHNPDLENIMKSRLTALHHQIQPAENEADRLSAGITSGTPEQVKQSMGERLGADFSSVRFHTGKSVCQKADNMGARAWTQGNDVYFGENGFHPAVAAHELVHTAQQGAVGSMAVHALAPMGEVQMWPNPFRWIRNWYRRITARPQAQPALTTQQQRIQMIQQRIQQIAQRIQHRQQQIQLLQQQMQPLQQQMQKELNDARDKQSKLQKGAKFLHVNPRLLSPEIVQRHMQPDRQELQHIQQRIRQIQQQMQPLQQRIQQLQQRIQQLQQQIPQFQQQIQVLRLQASGYGPDEPDESPE